MSQDHSNQIQTKDFSIQYEFIDGNILHAIVVGHMKESDIETISMLRDEAAGAMLQAGLCPFVLVDFSRLTGSSLRAVRYFIQQTKKYYSTMQAPTYIIYGAYPILKAMVNLARAVVPFKIHLAKDYETAMQLIQLEKTRKEEEGCQTNLMGEKTKGNEFDQTQLYVNELLAYLGNINWEGTGCYDQSPEIDPAHPFKPVFETIDLIKTAIDMLFQERKLVEDELRESEEKFKSLSQNTPDIIYTLDTHGAFTYINPAWEQSLGYRRRDVIGKQIWDFADEETRAQVRQFVQTIDHNEIIRDGALTLLHKNGMPLLFSMSGAPNFNASGQLIGIVGILKDITEHQRLEAQFQQAQKMEAIGTLAGGIAHDFNNLLMGMQGYVSLMLLDKELSHPDYERLKNIEKQIQSGADLTRQLLGFARAGKYQVQPSNLNDLIKKSAIMFGRTKREIRIHEEYEKELWIAEVDQGQIEQVLLNIYINAWQAMPGGGDLYLSTHNQTLDSHYVKPYEIKPGRYVKVSITDTGIGMDEKVRKRIFEPFFTTKEMGRGTGLGLASAYGIIKGHGGFINVYSELGHGTTFNIFIPASDKINYYKKITPEEQTPKGSETILVVDDEKVILMVTREILEMLGYTVLTAENGRKALDIYGTQGNQIDLVILDMIMPEMSGHEVFDELLKINPEIKVMLSSGYSLNTDAARIMERGCKAFIQKPFTLKELSQQVRKTLDGSRH